MVTQEVQGENYNVVYDHTVATIYFQGSLRLSGMADYQPIADLLNQASEQADTSITLDLKALNFLNSSGINMLSKFVIGMRKKNTVQVIVRGSEEVPWQEKSLQNLQRLMPTLQLELEAP
ncbi:slr1659 superfamily regulator [Leptolyngbya sp. 7M]|uniref:STAS domain-containing protein n=1 Tax=Leptolyngbya sp. NK1-12 TaxID=2547451 RepID=A0AA96WR37_9CYAN|nr:STAS domain-containing protein [Leptolyngbya sp. 7M]QYO68183.1 hypothetical protein JVX88_16295 [Leptolyngbya sp. 7M]WNZ27701.1 hypothetical protein HJG54_33175 [Leptolyngbya sp. NK1-12]